MTEAEARDGLAVFVLVFLSIASLMLAIRAYAPYVGSYIDYLTMPEYSYLIILIPTSIILIVMLLIHYFNLSKPSPMSLIASVSLFLGSMLFYVLGSLDEVNSAQLYGISFSLLIWSFIILIFYPERVTYFISALTLTLLTVPVPLSFISYTSTAFSQLIGRVVAYLMGAELIQSGSSIYIGVVDAEGTKRVFELVHACSGIISVTSIIAISPILLYFIFRSMGSMKEKVLKTIVVLGSAIAIVFVGNAARVAAVLYFTKYVSYERALEFFHQVPSLIYAGLAVLVSFLILEKTTKRGSREGISEVSHRTTKAFGSRFRKVMGVFIILVAVVSLFLTALLPSLIVQGAAVPSSRLVTLDTLLTHTARVVFNETGVSVLREVPVPALTARLGSSTVNMIVIKYNNTVLSGYAEVAERPTRFHGWHVCLTMQGYTIVRSWKEVHGDLVINYLLVEKSGYERLLGYALYRVPFLVSNGTSVAFVRISLFTGVRGDRNVDRAAELIREILEKPGFSYDSKYPQISFYTLLIIRNILVIANLVAFSAAIAGMAWSSLATRH